MLAKFFNYSRSWFAAFAALALLISFTQPANAAGVTSATVTWVKTLQGPGNQEIEATTIDSSGNVYVSGYLQGTYSNHTPPLTVTSVLDLYIAKFSSDGTEIWMKNFGTTAGGTVKDIAVDASGNVYATGTICGTATFGALGSIAATGLCDGFLMKLTSAGTPTWLRHWGIASEGHGSNALGLDNNGNIYVAAWFGDTDLAGATGIDGLTWSAPAGALTDGTVVIKFNSSGTAQYARAMPSGFQLDNYGFPFAVSGDGKVLIGGAFDISANFGSAGTFTTSGAGDYDAVWAQLDASGHITMAKKYGGTDQQTIRGIAFDRFNNIYVDCIYMSSVNVAGTQLTSIGVNDAFVAKFDSTGSSLTWLTHWGGPSSDDIDGMAVDELGNVVVSGSFRDTINFGSIGTVTSASAGQNDGIAVGLNSDGSLAWVKTVAGVSDNEFAWARPSAAAGAVYFAGRFNSNVSFGEGFTASFTTAANTVDGYLVKVSANWANPSSQSASGPAVQVGSISPRLIDSVLGGVVKITSTNASKITAVKLGTVSIAFKILSASQFEVTLPAHAVGYADLTFTTSEGSVPLSNAVRYSDVLNTRFGSITLVNPSKATLAKAMAKFAKISYTDRVVTKGKKPKVTITLTGRIKN